MCLEVEYVERLAEVLCARGTDAGGGLFDPYAGASIEVSISLNISSFNNIKSLDKSQSFRSRGSLCRPNGEGRENRRMLPSGPSDQKSPRKTVGRQKNHPTIER